jgi:hypothetical protein
MDITETLVTSDTQDTGRKSVITKHHFNVHVIDNG